MRNLSAEEHWKDCMVAAGFGCETAIEQSTKLSNRLHNGENEGSVKSEEIRIATASAQCEREQNIGQEMTRLQAKHEKMVADKNQALVITWVEENRAAAQRAKEILKK